MNELAMNDLDVHEFLKSPIPVHPVRDDFLKAHKVSLSVLRCDLIHPEISGNKWFKLKYNILAARKAKKSTILSFGGVWSNHIHALAAAGKYFGFNTIGLIRGEINTVGGDGCNQLMTPCLIDSKNNGMNLQALSREVYRNKNNLEFIDSLRDVYGDFFLVPEGGANLEGMQGCGELLSPLHWHEFDQICLACGTATTLTGLISATKTEQNKSALLGIQVLKGKAYLENEVNELIKRYNLSVNTDWSIQDSYHFGGYARSDVRLFEFIDQFKRSSGIQLEPVYSGKLIFAIYDLVKKGFFPPHSKVLAIHGGGLQGLRGYKRW